MTLSSQRKAATAATAAAVDTGTSQTKVTTLTTGLVFMIACLVGGSYR